MPISGGSRVRAAASAASQNGRGSASANAARSAAVGGLVGQGGRLMARIV